MSTNFVRFPTVLRPEHVDPLRAWGVQAPDPIPGLREEDGSFVQVKAPPGWKVDYHPHSMYLVLMDDRGLWRATYFAKRAAWDTRISFYSLERAVHTALYALNERKPNPRVGGREETLWTPRVVLGHRWILWEGEPAFFTEAGEAAAQVLAKDYPNARDLNAYWDLPVPDGAEEHEVQIVIRSWVSGARLRP